MSAKPAFYMGAARPLLPPEGPLTAYKMPPHHLVTHGVVVGMTGSGKTGFVSVLVEEALHASIPVLVIDVKGDLPNLLLTPAVTDAKQLEPWIEPPPEDTDPNALQRYAEDLAKQRREGLARWGIGDPQIAAYASRIHPRVITPGADAGDLLHVLSALERRSPRWDTDIEGARAALSAAVSLILRLLGRDADPARSREHVLLSVLAERRLVAGKTADITSLLEEVIEPPVVSIGALAVDAFIAKKARKELAAALNTLLASPTFAGWRQGTTLDVGEWMKPVKGRTPVTIVSVAHLDDDERSLVLGVILEEVLSWVRSLRGSQRLRAMVVFDEVYGFLPPHPANPPTKRPLVALMKQARAFGVGVVVATQNPMDLDYRALSNAGLWCLGRLQTDADRARVIDGLAGSGGTGDDPALVADVLRQLPPRWFLVRNANASGGNVLLQPRWAMSFLRGPMTRTEIRMARGVGDAGGGGAELMERVPMSSRSRVPRAS